MGKKKERIAELEREVECLRSEVDYLFKQLQIAKQQKREVLEETKEWVGHVPGSIPGYFEEYPGPAYHINETDEVITNE